MPGGDAFPTAFLDFDIAQAETSLTQRTGPVADGSQYHKYIAQRFMLGEASNVQTRQYGDSIRVDNILSARDSGQNFLPGDLANPTNTNHLSTATAHWRRVRWNVTYVEDEFDFNGMEPETHQWVNLARTRQNILDQDINDKVERDFWGVPYKSKMEGTSSDTDLTYSIWAHVNEDANGLFGENWTGNTWTVKQGQDPTTAAYGNNLKPRQRTYSNFTLGDSDSLLSGMSNLMKDLTWERPSSMKQYYEDPFTNRMVIVTSGPGQTVYENMIQNRQGGTDLFLAAGGVQDPSVPEPQYYGIPITWSDGFENAAVYDDGSNGLAVATAADITGPRFMFLNGNYLTPVIHGKDKFRQTSYANDPVNRPDVWVKWVILKYNIVCTSYRRQGFLSPSVDL